MGNLPINQGGISTNKRHMPSIDVRYGPYASKQEAHNALSPYGMSAVGLTVGIGSEPQLDPQTGEITYRRIKEYWYQGGISSEEALVEKNTGGGDLSNYYTKSETNSAISGALDELTGGVADTTDPHVEVEITQTNGMLTEVVVTTDDIASAQELAGAAFLGEEYGSAIIPEIEAGDVLLKKAQLLTASEKNQVKANLGIGDEFTRINNELETQKAAIELLNGNDVVPTDDHTQIDTTDPDFDDQKIYREPEAVVAPATDPTYYIDWMYDSANSTWKKLGKYDFPGVEHIPTRDSAKLIDSGGVYNALLPIVGATDEEIDLSGLDTYQGIMTTDSDDYSGTTENQYLHKYIPVQSGERFDVVNDSERTTVYAFVKSTGVDGEAVDLCDGAEKVGLLSGASSLDIVAPLDAVYLCVNTTSDYNDCAPTVTRKAVAGSLARLEAEMNVVEAAVDNCMMVTPTTYTTAQQEQILENAGIENPDQLIDLLKTGGGEASVVVLPVSNELEHYFIPSTGEITAGPGYTYNVRFYSLNGVSKVEVKGTSMLASDNPRAYAFYDGNTASANKIGDVGPQLSGSYDYILDVPSGATYIACCINTTDYRSLVVSSLLSAGTKLSSLINDVAELKTTSVNYGLYKQGNNYYHFTGNIIRLFKREGINNLFCLSAIYTGTVSDGGVSIGTTVQVCNTDNIGPISIFNTTLFPGVYGQWTGGYHGTPTTNYPTAKQYSLSVRVNDREVTEDGLYYGKVHIQAVNDLYFPQSITSNSFTNATKAIVETRDYLLDEVMHVKVKMRAVNDFRVSAYYGLQAVTIGFNTVTLLNNKKEFSIASLTQTYYLAKPERKYYMVNTTNNMHYDLTLLDTGLGMFDEPASKYGLFAVDNGTPRQKAYYYLIDGDASTYNVTANAVFGWEGIYDIYFD